MLPVLRLLKSVENVSTVEEMLEVAGANFDVEKRQASFPLDDNRNVYAPYHKGSIIVRKDTLDGIGMTSDSYGVVQYRDAVEFLNSLISTGTAKPYSATVTDNGARLHIIMKANDYVDMGNGELIDFYFYVAASHDQSSSITTMCTPIHSLSQTVFTPMDRGVVKFKHSSNVSFNMKRAASTFTAMNNEWRNHTDNFKNFIKFKLNDKEREVYFTMVCPGGSKQAEHTREKLVDIFQNGQLSSLDSCKDTLWGAFMSAQLYADYYKTVKRSRSGRSQDESRLEGRLTGAAARQKAQAYFMALKFASMSNLDV